MPLILFIFLAIVAGPGPVNGDSPLVVIVHPDRTDALGSTDIAKIYLKRRRYWRDGRLIVPINREARADARRRFEAKFLDPLKQDMVAYWNQRYFHGVFPPTVLESDLAVKRYVASDPNAIGYISGALVDDSVRVVTAVE